MANHNKNNDHLLELLQFRDYEISQLRSEIETLKKSKQRLLYLNQQMENGVNAILSSKRWKIGNFLGTIFQKILLRPEKDMPEEHLKKTLLKKQEWLKL